MTQDAAIAPPQPASRMLQLKLATIRNVLMPLSRVAKWVLRRPRHPGLRKMRRWLDANAGEGVKASDKFGNHYLLYPNDYIDFHIFVFGGYELPQLQYLRQQAVLLGCEAFLDIGANIGIYSLALRDLCAEVHAFEPDPLNLTRLRHHLALNAADNVTVHPFALGAERGEVALFLQRRLGEGRYNSGKTTLMPPQGPGYAEMQVRKETLDGLFGHWRGKTLCIKMDVEGAEGQVLDGMGQLLRHNVVLLQIELQNAPRHAEADSRLKALGLRPVMPPFKTAMDYFYTNCA